MGPPNPWTFALERFAVFLRDVIEPAVYPAAAPLEAAAFQSVEPVAASDAFKASYSPVSVGWQWGPRWSTAWFRLRGTVPASMAGRHVMLRFSTDTEALLWLPDTRGTPVPHHGLDANRDAITLHAPAKGGERVELHVEAACNHMFGDRGLQWDPPEIHRRWNSATPGLFERCELAVRDDAVWRLKWVYAFVLDLARQMPPDSARGQQLFGVLRRATNMLPDDAVAAHAAEACALLESVVRPPRGGAAGSATLCHAVGHAHIDTAWLWPLRETKRKCLRTFSTVLRNMEADPEYRFLCSQAQQYEYVRERSPELFAQIKRRVAEGRWEPGGAMWIEPDCTCPSGESLIRQCLHADRYWRQHFGDERGRQRFLYLPDTFGFPAQLPQIMRHCGLDTFITNKLHWNSTNTFPHTTFLWRGLDGSTVIAHQTPGMDYNATNTPKELIRGEKTHKNKDLPGTDPQAMKPRASASGRAESTGAHGARWLQPFGFGDGGGGPTDWSILYAHLAKDCDTLPRVRFSSATDFCDALHADVQHALKTDPHAVPTHDGELYLELHRGTYTTHARIKQSNAECEELLRQAEILTFAGPTRLPRDQELSAKAELDKAWKLVLLNQFHDILPGSSITWVYEDAAKDYEQVRTIAQALIDAGLERWGRSVDVGGRRNPILVFNPTSLITEQNADIDGRPLHDTPALFSARVVDDTPRKKSDIELPAEVSLDKLRNGTLVDARFNTQGQIVSLRSPVDSDADLCVGSGASGHDARATPMHVFELFEDRPRLWDAWDIDEEYRQKPVPIETPVKGDIIERSPSRCRLRFSRAIGRASSVSWTYTLRASSFLLEVETVVDWQEEHRLLRVSFPTAINASDAVFGTQFGWRRRSVFVNTPHDRAAFEVPFHGYITLDDGSNALTLAAVGRHGADCRGSTVGLSLLRASRYPDPRADIGTHTFRYAIVPGARISGAEAYESLISPPLTRRLAKAATPARPRRSSYSPLEFVESTSVRLPRVSAMKPAADDPRLIVRLAEEHGQPCEVVLNWGFKVKTVTAVDGLERPLKRSGVEHSAKRGTTVKFRPFEIVTLAVTRAD